MRKVFLCHSSADKGYVAIVAKKLGRARVVFDAISFDPGRDFRDEIQKHLTSTDLFVFFASKASLGSVWCKYEIDEAYFSSAASAIHGYLTIIIDDQTAFSDLPRWMQRTKAMIQTRPSQGTRDIQHALFAVGLQIDARHQALAHPHYKAPLKPNQGRGVASGYWFNAGGESSAQMSVNEDGTIVVMTGHPDIGGSRASTANIAAELLGIDHSKVQVLIGDTSSIGFSNLTGGSRVTFASAMVVTQAADKVIKTLCERAAKIWKIEPDAVTWDNGFARPAGDRHQRGSTPARALRLPSVMA